MFVHIYVFLICDGLFQIRSGGPGFTNYTWVVRSLIVVIWPGFASRLSFMKTFPSKDQVVFPGCAECVVSSVGQLSPSGCQIFAKRDVAAIQTYSCSIKFCHASFSCRTQFCMNQQVRVLPCCQSLWHILGHLE